MASNMLPMTIVIIATLLWQVTASGEICKEDVDCNEKNSERCQKFDGCKKGTCACKEGYVTWMQYGGTPEGMGNICLRLLKVGDSCANTTGTCGQNVKCWQGTCECMQSNWEADATGYSCVHKADDNYKGDGGDCSTSQYVCKGGTTCKSNTCRCRDRSTWNTVHKSCIHDNSETGLVEGDRCTGGIYDMSRWSSSYYSSPMQICATNLMCVICPEDSYKSGYNMKACRKLPFNGAGVASYNAAITVLMAFTAGVKLLY